MSKPVLLTLLWLIVVATVAAFVVAVWISAAHLLWLVIANCVLFGGLGVIYVLGRQGA